MNSERNLPLRIVAAILVLAGGAIHLKLWLDGYRDIDKIGPAFLLNAVGSAGAAIVIVVWRHWIAPLAGLAVVNGSLLAFGLSRTNRGIVDFYETGWNPSPEAAGAVAVEIGAAIVLILAMVVEARGRTAGAAASSSTAVAVSPWAPPGGPPPNPPSTW